MHMSTKQWRAWDYTRQRHTLGSFALIHGVLAWGLPVALIVSVWDLWTGDHGSVLATLVRNIIAFGLAGALWHVCKWWWNEQRYQCTPPPDAPPQ